ncbi:hypothetical protein BH09BAC2_BH09BAC2_11780 [soil metagenome]
MAKKILIPAVLFLLCLSAVHAQHRNSRISKPISYSGVWKGTVIDRDAAVAGFNDTADYVLEVNITWSLVTGISTTYYYKDGQKYINVAKVKGTINRETQQITVVEYERVQHHTPAGVGNCLLTHKLSYTKRDEETELLTGVWEPSPEETGSCGKGFTALMRDHDLKVPKKIVPPPTDIAVVTPAPPARDTLVWEPTQLVKRYPDYLVVNKPLLPTAKANAVAMQKPKLSRYATDTLVLLIPKPQPAADTLAFQKPAPPKPVIKPVETPKPAPVIPKPVVVTAAIQKPPPPPKPAPKPQVTVVKPPVTKPVETVVVRKPEPPKPIPVVAYQERTKSFSQTIDIKEDSIKVDFYDNGEVDGDSISVFFNGKVITAHLLLTERAATFKLPIDRSKAVNELVMYAENLGTQPPNTALMVVKDGDKLYEVRITSDLSKSGTILFRPTER